MSKHAAPILLGIGLTISPLALCAGWLWLRWLELAARMPAVADAIRVAVFTLPVLAVLPLAGLAGLALYNRTRWAAVQADKIIALTRAQTVAMPALTHLTYSGSRPQLAAPAIEAATEAPALPGPLDLAALAHHQPSRDSILLAIGPSGPITASVAGLCHVALLGSTGGGKSNLLRLLVPQLQAVGARVCLADPHYAPIDVDSGDDWRAIEQRLFIPPAVKPREIAELLSFFSEELQRRLELRRDGQPVGPPLFLAFDELPVIADTVPGSMVSLGKLLREGRKVGLLTIGASQSMLVKEVGGSSALRDQYRTAIYVGGDRKSASALLDIPERSIDDSPLGRGVVLLRAAGHPAALARVPLASNEAIAGLLGAKRVDNSGRESQPSFGFRLPQKSEPVKVERRSDEGQESRLQSDESQTAKSSRSARILAMFRSGKSVAEIVKELEGISSGARYNQARAEVEAVLREAMGG